MKPPTQSHATIGIIFFNCAVHTERDIMLVCEISGEPLAVGADSNNGTDNDIVVTPSGHVCLKRLLLSKLAENGGIDPFDTTNRSVLTEESLIVLNNKKASSASSSAPPPPPSSSSFSSLLRSMGKEYDNVLLELFDTRKILQETRRELSEALYQNDAAIRVVARLSLERDQARQDLQRFQLQQPQAPQPQPQPAHDNNSNKRPRLEEKEEEETTTNNNNNSSKLPLENDIPAIDLQHMLNTWNTLHQNRKKKSKEMKKSNQQGYELGSGFKPKHTESWHLSTCRGVTAVDHKTNHRIVSAGLDKQIVVYDPEKREVVLQWSAPVQVTTLGSFRSQHDDDEHRIIVVAGGGNKVLLYDSLSDTKSPVYTETLPGEDDDTAVVQATIHPTGKHIVVATNKGTITIWNNIDGRDQEEFPCGAISSFHSQEQYTTGALHPDGLIYAAGTIKGEILLWDFKSKLLAGTLKSDSSSPSSENNHVVALAFSNNGYHLAASYQSGIVLVWDLRKQKVVAELNKDRKLKTVATLAFHHENGKYLAYGGDGGVVFTTVKEWGVTATLPQPEEGSPVNGFLWDLENRWVAVASEKSRAVAFYENPRDE